MVDPAKYIPRMQPFRPQIKWSDRGRRDRELDEAEESEGPDAELSLGLLEGIAVSFSENLPFLPLTSTGWVSIDDIGGGKCATKPF